MATLPELNPEKTPRISYRTKRKFEMRETEFPEEVNEAIKIWLHKQIETRRKQLKNRHSRLVPEWRRIAEGKPREEKKSWPFENCSNLIHQVVGEASEDMSARVMGIVWQTSPIAIYKYMQKAQEAEEDERNSKKAKILEQAMDYFAYEPTELELYEKENIWFTTSNVIGTGWLCVVPEHKQEMVYVGYDKQKKGSNFQEETLYEGPKVLNLRDEECLYDPDADCPEDSDFFSRRITLTKRQLQDREFKGLYKKGSVSEILGKPDRYGPEEQKRRDSKNKGVTHVEEQVLAEWDIEECYFYWFHKNKKFRLIAWYHYETKTAMNQVFNFIPENQLPVVRTRLSSGEKGMNGRGLADIGDHLQEEVSTTKNQRIDATTWGILGINRFSPQQKNIDRNFKIFPGCALPFGQNEFEHFEVANPAMHAVSQKNEEMMIQQARERFGIGPAVAGQGAGGQIDKKGRYGSMGTFAVMQDSNTRIAHRTSDFRHSHVRLFGLLTDMYGAMGLGKKGSIFGIDDSLLSEALTDYLERRVRIPIRAATASANREVTKQNELLLNQATMMFVQEQTKMLQMTMNAGIPPFVQKWMRSVIKGRIRLFQQILRDFQLSDQPTEFMPDIEFEEEKQGATDGQAQAGDPRIVQMAQRLRKPGGVPAVSGAGGVEATGQGPGVASPGTVL